MYSLIAVGSLVIIVPVLYVLVVTYALRVHAEEDNLAWGRCQVERAIYGYVEKHGSAPAKLENLIPEFLDSVPVFPRTSNVHYSVTADGQGWTLDLYRPRGGKLFIYRRTNVPLSAEDAQRTLRNESGYYVLRAR